MSQLATIQQTNLPANIEAEADNLLATTKGHEKLLKFKKGKFEVMDDEVPLGTEFVGHATQLVFCWIKFSGNTVVDRKMGRAADRFVPPEREELGDTDQSQWEVRDGELKDPWTFQHLLPLENLETGEVMVFTTSSIGGQIATEELVQQYAKRVRRQKSSALPIVRLAVKEMPTKKFGKVLRPLFEVVGWEDAPAASAASASSTMRTVSGNFVPCDEVPNLDAPPHDGDEIPW